jgi:PAS domain S-box-containing protein
MSEFSPQIDRQFENARATEFFREHQTAVFKRTDHLFSVLLPLQWLAGVVAACFVSPLAWTGAQSNIHPHIWEATFFGGLIVSLPLFLVMFFPGQMLTRYIVAVAQMLMSGLLIHLTGGRIETHFHVFGSLAFLSFYRDWRVLIPATLVTAVDHFLRGWFYPFSIYGVFEGAEWRWLEHAGWVIFTDIFLIASCRRSVSEMWEIARRATALDASEQRYRTVVEQMTDGIFLLEPENFRVIECNEAFARLIGCQNVEEAKTLTAYDFDASNPEEVKIMSKILREENRSLSTERKFRKRDGSWIQVEITGRYIFYNNIQAYCVNARDITERKRAEAELRKLAVVAEQTQNAVIITDPKGRIQWANGGFTRITGYKLIEVVGKKPGSFLQGKDTDPTTVSTIREAINSRKPFEGEIYNYGKDGRGYWLSISIMPMHDSKGRLTGFIAVEMDISERKKMEDALRQAHDELEHRVNRRTAELLKTNEAMQIEMAERKRAEKTLGETQQFLRKVIDNIPNLIFVKDVHGRFTLANRALAELYGTKVDNLIGKTDADFLQNPSEVAQIQLDDQHVVEHWEEKRNYEEKLTDAKGQVHWMQTVKRPMLGDTGVEHILGIGTDLTERKILESHLRHAQKLESIGQLAAGIAHEINTPTQYVGDNTRFIRDAFADINLVLQKYRELLEAARDGEIKKELIVEVEEEIKNADMEYLVEEVPMAVQQSLEGVSRIAKIVESMKDFAHPGSKEKKAEDLNKAIQSTVTVARNEWKYVADMELKFDESLPPVPCLVGEFNQVILNMVINAAHTIADVVGDGSNGKGKITIQTKKVDSEWAEIRVSDTGTGIPKKIQSRVFDPFFTTKEVGKGTGQGLAISHNVVVEKHGGKLSFETEIGKGTTFIIRLPLGDSPNSVTKGHNVKVSV